MVIAFWLDVLFLLKPSFGLALLATPLVFIKLGIFGTSIALIICAFLEIISVLIQLELSRYVPKKSVAFAVLLHQINPNLVLLFDSIISLRTFGACIMYICLSGQLFHNLVSRLLHIDETNSILNSKCTYIFTITSTIILPLAITKRINVIKYMNQITTAFISIIIMTLPIDIFFTGKIDQQKDTSNNTLKNSNGGNWFLISILLFILKPYRSLYPILNEPYSSYPYTIKVFVTYLGLITLITLSYGLFGYYYFFNHHSLTGTMSIDDIIQWFSQTTHNNHPLVDIILTLLLLISTVLCIPLSLSPLRSSIYHLLDTYKVKTNRRDSEATLGENSASTTYTTYSDPYKTDATISDTNNTVTETTPLITLEGREVSIDEMIEEGYSEWLRFSVMNTTSDPRFFMVTTTVLISSGIISSFVVPSLTSIVILLGSTTSVIMTFILPGILGKYFFGMEHWKNSDEEFSIRKRIYLFGSIIFIILGISISIYCISSMILIKST